MNFFIKVCSYIKQVALSFFYSLYFLVCNDNNSKKDRGKLESEEDRGEMESRVEDQEKEENSVDEGPSRPIRSRRSPKWHNSYRMNY